MTESLTAYSAGEPASLDLTLLRQLAHWGRARGLDPVRQVVQAFLVATPPRLRELAHAMEAADTAGVRRAAHALCGGCGQVGARHMAHLAAFLDTEARDGLTHNQHLVRVLSREFESVRVALEREFLTEAAHA